MPKRYLFINHYDNIETVFKLPVFDTSNDRFELVVIGVCRMILCFLISKCQIKYCLLQINALCLPAAGRLYALRFMLYALTVLYQRGLCQRENREVKRRNRSDLNKESFRTIIRIVRMVNIRHVGS